MRSTRRVGTLALGLVLLAIATPDVQAEGLLSRLFKRSRRAKPEARTTEAAAPAPSAIKQVAQEVVEPSPSLAPAPQPASLDHLTLDEALRIAEARQPQLLAALAAIDAAAGRYRQARTYPNPSVDVRGEQMPETEFVAGVNQPVILGQRRQRAMRAATRDIEARQNDYAFLHARVLWEVKQAYMQVVGLQQLIELAAKQVRTAQTLVEKTQQRFEQGDVAERDVLRAEVDLSTVRIQTDNLERALTEARKTLATRMGIATATVGRCEGELRPPEQFGSEEELTQRLLDRNPDLQAALAEVQFRTTQAAQARAERIPDATVTVLYRRITETNQDTADVGISLPLPLFDRRTGRIQEAAAESSRSQARYDATRNDLLGQFRRAYESLLTYYHQAESYEQKILPKTDRSLELVRIAYDAGDASILDVLDAQRQRNTAHAAYLQVLSDLMQKWLEVEYLVSGRSSQ